MLLKMDDEETVQVQLRMDDRLTIPSERKIQDSGAMIARCAIARTGNLTYKASEMQELFADRDPESLITVAQLPEDLFAEATLEKFRSAPVTIGHPAEDVTAANMKELSVGMLEGKPEPDADKLESSIVLADKEAIDLVEEGTVELSACCYYNVVRVEDKDYDAVRTITKVNHVAIVQRGRAGRECKIYDAAIEVVEDEKEEVKMSDAGVEIKLSSMRVKLIDAETELAHAEVKAVKQVAEIEALTQKLSDAEAKVITPEALEAIVLKRATLVADIKRLCDADVSGLTEISSKRKAVETCLGDGMKEKTDAHIELRYEILLEDSDSSPSMAAIFAQKQQQELVTVKVSKAEQAHINMIKRHEGIK